MSSLTSPHRLFLLARSEFTPVSPGPGDKFAAGSACSMQWDGDTSGTWTNVTIDLMSGSNGNMTHVTNVATGLDGTNTSLSPFSWTCPEVDPYSDIYFYQYTNGDDIMDAKWTSRFTITSPSGESVPPSDAHQPNGDPVPWGNGYLVDNGAEAHDSTSTQATAADDQDDSKTEQGNDDTEDAETSQISPSYSAKYHHVQSPVPDDGATATDMDGSVPTATSASTIPTTGVDDVEPARHADNADEAAHTTKADDGTSTSTDTQTTSSRLKKMQASKTATSESSDETNSNAVAAPTVSLPAKKAKAEHPSSTLPETSGSEINTSEPTTGINDMQLENSGSAIPGASYRLPSLYALLVVFAAIIHI
ncbi:hypothetical protein B0H21DRAFT_182468 [Amylocystis lapponica]|nr:hypothetical protein B0H21DRAFT_182468 [Amylocystis lapponica]